MACKDFEELILRDLDGEIQPAERTRLQGHMTECAPCRTDRESYARIDESLRRVTSPAVPRRDFASEAIAKAESMQTTAPRRIRRPVSGVVWATLGVLGVLVVLGGIGLLLWYGVRPPEYSEKEVAIVPEVAFKIEEPKVILPKDDRPLPTHREPTYEELRARFRFGDVDPVEEMVRVNLHLASTESAVERIRLLHRGVRGLLDAFDDACARGNMTEASDLADAVRVLVREGLAPLLLDIRAAGFRGELEEMAKGLSEAYSNQMAFGRELSLERKAEVERVMAFCAEARDAVRTASRRQEVQ